MVNDGKKRLTEDEIAALNLTTEVLYDKYGNAYQFSERYLSQQIEQRRPSEERETQLFAARELLRSNLKELSKSQRDVMALIVTGHSQQEVSNFLDISRRSVRTHLQRAKHKLAKLIYRTQEVIQNVKSNVSKRNTDSSRS